MSLTNNQLNYLENLPSFERLDYVTKTTVVKHFFDFRSDFETIKRSIEPFDNDTERVILCRKCLRAELKEQSVKGMIKHFLAHTLDNLSRRGLTLNITL